MYVSILCSTSGHIVAEVVAEVAFVGTSHGIVYAMGGDFILVPRDIVAMQKGDRVLLACDEGTYWYGELSS